MTTIHVATGAPYDVEVGRGVLDRLPAVLGPDVRRVALVRAPGLSVDLSGLLSAYEVRFAHGLELPLRRFGRGRRSTGSEDSANPIGHDDALLFRAAC